MPKKVNKPTTQIGDPDSNFAENYTWFTYMFTLRGNHTLHMQVQQNKYRHKLRNQPHSLVSVCFLCF